MSVYKWCVSRKETMEQIENALRTGQHYFLPTGSTKLKSSGMQVEAQKLRQAKDDNVSKMRLLQQMTNSLNTIQGIKGYKSSSPLNRMLVGMAQGGFGEGDVQKSHIGVKLPHGMGNPLAVTALALSLTKGFESVHKMTSQVKKENEYLLNGGLAPALRNAHSGLAAALFPIMRTCANSKEAAESYFQAGLNLPILEEAWCLVGCNGWCSL